MDAGYYSLRAAGLRMLRRGGVRALLASASQYARARWYLRDATSVGSARLWGRALVVNRGGTLTIGDRVRMYGHTVRLELVCFGGELAIGDNTFINYGTNISATQRVTIGRNCAIGQYAIIMDNDYHQAEDHAAIGTPAPVEIEDDVWIGARVTVLPGAHIGRGAVIGAHSVVKGDIPPYTLAAGAPARVLRQLRAPERDRPAS